MIISLREMRDSDLPVYWEQLTDPEARYMAGVTGEYHYDRVLFDHHWAKIRADPTIVHRTVLADDVVVGHAAVYGPPEEREVTYWIDRSHWGRGIATAALSALIDLEPTRPLHAHAVADNTGSIRVLQKCGFVITAHGRWFARARGGDVDDVALTLE